MVMRTLPSSSEEKTTRPFFIRIKDVPQISDKKSKINQASVSCDIRPEEDEELMARLF